jgi:hypothetical protein
LGVDVIEKAVDVDYGSVNAHTAAWFRSETSRSPKEEGASTPQPQNWLRVFEGRRNWL